MGSLEKWNVRRWAVLYSIHPILCATCDVRLSIPYQSSSTYNNSFSHWNAPIRLASCIFVSFTFLFSDFVLLKFLIYLGGPPFCFYNYSSQISLFIGVALGTHKHKRTPVRAIGKEDCVISPAKNLAGDYPHLSVSISQHFLILRLTLTKPPTFTPPTRFKSIKYHIRISKPGCDYPVSYFHSPFSFIHAKAGLEAPGNNTTPALSTPTGNRADLTHHYSLRLPPSPTPPPFLLFTFLLSSLWTRLVLNHTCLVSTQATVSEAAVCTAHPPYSSPLLTTYRYLSLSL
jgi:hypothetical protein